MVKLLRKSNSCQTFAYKREERGDDKDRTVFGSNAMNLIFLLMAWLPILIGALGIAFIFYYFYQWMRGFRLIKYRLAGEVCLLVVLVYFLIFFLFWLIWLGLASG